MTLYGRMLDGDDSIDWKWVFCASCRMEWLVPGIDPDAFPKFCCHCREPIDMNIKPHDVLDDVESEESHVTRYDLNAHASQITNIELSPETHFRIYAKDEFAFVGEDEQKIVSACLTFLVNDWLVLNIQMSHDTCVNIAGMLEEYTELCFDIIAEGKSIVDHPDLIRFNGFNAIGEKETESEDDDT